MSGIVPHVNALGYAAAEAAYRDGAAWRAALLDYLRVNEDLVLRAVQEMPGLATTHVEATYLAWIDAKGTGLEDPAAFFEAAGVGLGNGVYFGGPGFLRLTFGCPRSMLIEGLDRMRNALASR
jgi:cystathionine beta-lyase